MPSFIPVSCPVFVVRELKLNNNNKKKEDKDEGFANLTSSIF